MDDQREPVTSTETSDSTPMLMRAARGAYAGSIRAELHAAGIDDLPRNGAFVLAGIDTSGGPRTDLPGDLGVTKQAVSQVIDILASRGYLVRNPDPGDRRRISLELTERGRAAVAAVRRGIDVVDQHLSERITPEQAEAMRSALLALAQIRTAGEAAGAGRPARPGRPDRQLRRFCPIFPVRDLAAALAHYASLGFHAEPHEEGDSYGFVNRERVGLHLEERQHGDHAAAYLYVRDADAIYQEWSRPGIGGRTSPVVTTDYQMREGSHTDPDGNLIHFGSAIEATPAEDQAQRA
jgi:DNA-binding MarR family transcriptional regulator